MFYVIGKALILTGAIQMLLLEIIAIVPSILVTIGEGILDAI